MAVLKGVRHQGLGVLAPLSATVLSGKQPLRASAMMAAHDIEVSTITNTILGVLYCNYRMIYLSIYLSLYLSIYRIFCLYIHTPKPYSNY